MIYDNSEAKMHRYPKVSVIIPSYNGLELLKMSIPALLRTHYPNFEVVVLDNGSSDDSSSFLSKAYPMVSVVSLKKNIGVARAYNLGISTAHGSLLSFLNNDMEVDPEWLLPLVLAMESNEELAACDSKYINYYERNKIDHSGGAGRFIDKYGNSISRGGGEIDRGQFDVQEEVFHALSLFKKDLVLKAGRFDEAFFGYYEETELCWRLHRLGYKILFVPKSVIYHMGSATTSLKSAGKESKNTNKKVIVFHFYKNRLRMLIKNQFGVSLLISLLVCLIDFCGSGLLWLVTGNSAYVPTLGKALVWNLANIKGTFQNRFKFKEKSSSLDKLFFPYSGVWRTRGSVLG
jgi:GT2 family glycosyltransferase